MKVLLTGGRGKLGTAIVNGIIEAGHTITIADIKDCEATYDLKKYENAQKAVEGRDVVIHLAGIPHPSSQPFARYFETNVRLSFNVLQASLKAGVKRVIYASSSASYGTDAAFKPLYVPIDEEHPFSVDMAPNENAHWQYPCSKRIVDTMMLAYGKSTPLETVILRMGPLHKTEDYFGGMYKQNWAQKCLFAWSDPRDMADAFIKAATMPGLKCDVFNVMGTAFPENFKPDDLDPVDWFREWFYGGDEGAKRDADFPNTKVFFKDEWFDNRVREDGRHLSFYSSERARRVLGWEAEY